MGDVFSGRCSHGCVVWPLRISVVVASLAAAWMCWTQYSALNAMLYMRLELSERFASSVDVASSVALLVTAIAAATGRWKIGLLLGVAWFGAQALATAQVGGAPLSELAPLAHSARIVAPLGLLMIWRGQSVAAERFLRFAAAITFAVHGVEALAESPAFLDLLLLTAYRFEVPLNESAARLVLLGIGLADCAVAVLAMTCRWRGLAAYMVLWAVIALGARLTAGGFEQWMEALLRVANAGVPLALFFLWPAHKRSVAKMSP